MVKNIPDLVRMIKKRDDITLYEAQRTVDECVADLKEIIENNGTLNELEDAVAYDLGLEPDYLPMLIEEII